MSNFVALCKITNIIYLKLKKCSQNLKLIIFCKKIIKNCKVMAFPHTLSLQCFLLLIVTVLFFQQVQLIF